MDEKRSVNFTIIPDEAPGIPRVYSNFCSIQNSPFDFSLTFCEMQPLGEREIGARRWIFAQTVLPQSSVRHHPWLRELGDRALGESLSAVEDVRREPLECLELHARHPLAQAAGADASTGSLWARRAVYRLGDWPILVQEVFLPALGRCD